MRRAARRDANHAAIREALRDIPGVSVADTANLGDGFPDLVVGVERLGGIDYRNLLLEVKDGSRPPYWRKLTPAEARFRDDWKGQYAIVESVEQAVDLVLKVRNG